MLSLMLWSFCRVCRKCLCSLKNAAQCAERLCSLKAGEVCLCIFKLFVACQNCVCVYYKFGVRRNVFLYLTQIYLCALFSTRRNVSVSLLSEPDTLYPSDSKISAIGHIPAPPMPIKCIFSSFSKVHLYFSRVCPPNYFIPNYYTTFRPKINTLFDFDS